MQFSPLQEVAKMKYQTFVGAVVMMALAASTKATTAD